MTQLKCDLGIGFQDDHPPSELDCLRFHQIGQLQGVYSTRRTSPSSHCDREARSLRDTASFSCESSF